MLVVKAGATDVTIYVKILDSSSSTGAGLTGLAYNTASLTAYYVRPLGSATAITLATQTVTGAHSDGGFVEVSSTNMPGIYRLDLPDAVVAANVNSVVVQLKGAANMVPVEKEIQLKDYYTANEIADALLKRDMSAVTGEAARSPLNALRFLRNKWSISGTTLTVTKEDDSTSAWTSALTESAGANPITGSDPA